MNTELENILKQHDLRKTNLRLKILAVLKNANCALSQPEIENEIAEELDRISVYRILKSFEEKNIIHRVFDIWGTPKFAFSIISINQTTTQHLHFTCTNCRKVFCLGEYQLPQVTIPNGFSLSQLDLSAQGLCNNCSKK